MCPHFTQKVFDFLVFVYFFCCSLPLVATNSDNKKQQQPHLGLANATTTFTPSSKSRPTIVPLRDEFERKAQTAAKDAGKYAPHTDIS